MFCDRLCSLCGFEAPFCKDCTPCLLSRRIALNAATGSFVPKPGYLCRILREYLREETYLLEAAESYNFERVIDDFVLLCVLVGNDFLPHSPTLDIGEGAMDVIFETYRETLVKNGHHLTQGERISHVQLEVLLAALAEKEADTLISRAEVGTRLQHPV